MKVIAIQGPNAENFSDFWGYDQAFLLASSLVVGGADGTVEPACKGQR